MRAAKASRAGRWLVGLAAALMVAQAALGAEFTLEVAAGASDRAATPVCVDLDEARILATMPMDKRLPLAVLVAHGEVTATVTGRGGAVPAQVEALGEGKARLWWILGELAAGQKATLKARIQRRKAPADKGFAFHDEPGKHLDLLFDGRKVTRLMYQFNPDPTQRFPTSKPFTHVFDAAGETLITSPGGQPYPHHRGIFIGWNRTTLPDGTRYDFWHTRNVWQRLEKFASKATGPVFGRMVAEVRWEDPKGEAVVVEERAITVYRQAKPELLLDFVSTLRSQLGELKLQGDPEHAGVQFRPHPDVAKRGKETRYVHPPGMKPGKKGTLDMPWSTLSYALGDSRFNVAHLNHPTNPQGTLYSAYRPYGRFGAYAKATLKADEPLAVRYRIYVREGKDAALTVDEAQRLYADYARPPVVTVK